MSGLLRVFIVALSLLHNPGHAQAQERYFPPLALDPFFDRWFSSYLHALWGPSLFKKSGDQSTYRFTWLRTFHRPYAFRVTVAANKTATFTMKLSSGAGGYHPGQLIEERSYLWWAKMLSQSPQRRGSLNVVRRPRRKI